MALLESASYYAGFISKQFNAETPNGKSKEAEADDSHDDARQQGGPEAETLQQCGKDQKHGQRGNDVPKGIPGVIGDLLLRLLLDVKPNKRQHSDKRKRSNKAAQFVAAFRSLGYQHHNCAGQDVFCDEPSQNYFSVDA